MRAWVVALLFVVAVALAEQNAQTRLRKFKRGAAGAKSQTDAEFESMMAHKIAHRIARTVLMFDGFEHQETAHDTNPNNVPNYFHGAPSTRGPLPLKMPSGLVLNTDSVELPWSQGVKTSFSETTAMAGDYFGSKLSINNIICSTDFTLRGYISNNPPRPPNNIAARFTAAFNDFDHNDYYVKSGNFQTVINQIRELHRAEEQAVQNAEAQHPGGDLSSLAYASMPISSGAIVAWTTATRNAAWVASKSGYQEMAYNLVMNDDHFSTCAKEVYLEGVRVAKQHAAQAHTYHAAGNNVEADKSMILAYKNLAFVTHFFTDLFSAGHTRAERSLLRPFCYGNTNEMPAAGLTSNLMHDEDGKNCLLVTNSLRQLWWACGDEQFLDRVNIANRKVIRDALAAAIGELTDILDGVPHPRAGGEAHWPTTDFASVGFSPSWTRRLRLENTCPRFIFQKNGNTNKWEMSTRRNTKNTHATGYNYWIPRPAAAIPNGYGHTKDTGRTDAAAWDGNNNGELTRVFHSDVIPPGSGADTCEYWPWVEEGKNTYCCGVTGGRATPQMVAPHATAAQSWSSTCNPGAAADSGFIPEQDLPNPPPTLLNLARP